MDMLMAEPDEGAYEHDYSNQTDIFNPENQVWPVSLIGLGGIGSMVALKLMKLGINRLIAYDPDFVERHNLPYQMYRPCDVGLSKAEATAEILRMFGYPNVEPHAAHVDADTVLEGVVIAGVDSMAARQEIWEAVKWNFNVPLFMDGRLGGEHTVLYTLNPCDPDAIERYEKTFFTDEEAAPLPCAARAVIHPAIQMSEWLVTQITNFTRQRAVPFSITSFTPDFQTYAF